MKETNLTGEQQLDLKKVAEILYNIMYPKTFYVNDISIMKSDVIDSSINNAREAMTILATIIDLEEYGY